MFSGLPFFYLGCSRTTLSLQDRAPFRLNCTEGQNRPKGLSFFLLRASIQPRLKAVVVLLTPPLWLNILIKKTTGFPASKKDYTMIVSRKFCNGSQKLRSWSPQVSYSGTRGPPPRR